MLEYSLPAQHHVMLQCCYSAVTVTVMQAHDETEHASIAEWKSNGARVGMLSAITGSHRSCRHDGPYLGQPREQDTASLGVISSCDRLARGGNNPRGIGKALNPGRRCAVVDVYAICASCQDVKARSCQGDWG